MMHVPFVCTNNTLGNIDYGIPIVASKSTDYRTTTSSFHRLVPEKPQEFDCRIKADIKPELLAKDVAIGNEVTKSEYNRGYNWKLVTKDKAGGNPIASHIDKVCYVRNVQENFFKNPPPPKICVPSEMKDKYYRRFVAFDRQQIFPPNTKAKCEIKGLGRDEQPSVPPEEKGYWKWLDPYLSTARRVHIPFMEDQQNGVARKNVVTFYDAANLPKVKGFGPRNGPATEPLVIRKKIPMTDHIPFKLHPVDKHVHIPMKRVPNFGKTSEYTSNYKKQSFSDLKPYLFQNGVAFPESLPKSSAWQDLASPGMYCTEYCHLRTGWPVNAVVDYGVMEEHERLIHKPYCA